MSVRRLVIEIRLGHESQRRNSNSIVKFLSHSEYRSSLSGFSSHWLIIIRSLIRSAGDDTILFFRLRRRIRFDFLNSWMRITMHVRQKSMHVRQKCARIHNDDVNCIDKIWTFFESFTLKRDTLRIYLLNCIDGRLVTQRVIWSGYLG